MEEPLAPKEAARTIIRAVNAKDAELYASVFAEEAIIQLYDGPVRIAGRSALKENRAGHFVRYPEIRCEILTLIEIGNIVIMHDRVWLTPDAAAPIEVVEIFTFGSDGLITKMAVIQ